MKSPVLICMPLGYSACRSATAGGLLITCVVFAWLAETPAALADRPPVDFVQQIVPVFQTHCIRCHSPGNEKGDFSLATFGDLRDSDFVTPGDPDASYLIELISGVGDDAPQMPQDSEPLSAEEVALIRSWIAAGAPWPEDVIIRDKSKADASWWSLQPLAVTTPELDAELAKEVLASLPDELADRWLTDPIDRFILAGLIDQRLHPNGPADKRTLIRRATYDLTGLPPSPQEVEAFVSNTSARAYESLIDRLLASPHYGERWGRHWLDVVRFGESNGYERNVLINTLWPFRDYVIGSFNDDKPFDLFIREHLAGDVFGKDQVEPEIGTAFLVAGPYDDVGNQDPAQAAQIRADTIDEIIRASSEAFLGLTIGCSRCHDHKFDPISQTDYYSLYATFAGIRHGNRVLATPAQRAAHAEAMQPLTRRRSEINQQIKQLDDAILARAQEQAAELEQRWSRPRPDRQGTEETFDPVAAKFVRLLSLGQDIQPNNALMFGIDEFEIWSAGDESRNVALASAGAIASGSSRQIEDFPGAYGPHLAIDGKTGERFLATGGSLTIELAEPTPVHRVFFSSARGEQNPDQRKFAFVAEYRIDISIDGMSWTEVAHSRDRQPVSDAHREKRLREWSTAEEEQTRLAKLRADLAQLDREIAAVPALPSVWIGNRVAEDAKGPFHLFLGGSPQRLGDKIQPASLTALNQLAPHYQLGGEPDEAQRRIALADWIVHADNPLTPRVLANRVWQYHFGTGIVDTPSDLGYMGGRPTHPRLLDWLAGELQSGSWQLKSLHKKVMLSQTYRQSSEHRAEAAQVDANARLLWRFPPRRLAAEEIRDTMLMIADELDTKMGGPGFRLYQFMQDNVCTYIPLDRHDRATYRRAVYHQNARASIVDLMTDFDQPDCAFSIPRRAETTTPLQALTMLNHTFTQDMAGFLAARLEREVGGQVEDIIARAFRLCYARPPTDEEVSDCRAFIAQHGLIAFCRVLLNTSEMIYVQ